MALHGSRAVLRWGAALAVVAAGAACGDDDTPEIPLATVVTQATEAVGTSPLATASRSSTATTTDRSSTTGSGSTTAAGESTAPSGPSPSPVVVSPSGSTVAADGAFGEGADPCPHGERPAAAAFEAGSGDLRWTACSRDEVYRDVLGTSDDVVLVGTSVESGRKIVAYAVDDGRELWRRDVPEPDVFFFGWPKGDVAGGGVVVVADHASRGDVVGLDAVTGSERWRTSGALPIAHTESVAVTLSSSGQVTGLDRSSGEQLWTSPTPELSDGSGDVSAWTAARVLEDRIFLPAGPETIAIDLRSGAELWRGPQLDHPWAADNRVVGGMPESTGLAEIGAADASSGELVWTAPGRESYPDRIALGDGGVYVNDPDTGGVVAYEATTGARRWVHPLEPYLGEPQAVLDGSVFTLWEDVLAASSTADGALRWAWRRPVGSDWMNNLGVNHDAVFVAVNSLPFGD